MMINFTSVLLVLACINITRSTDIHQSMMELISSRPLAEQFKLWHYFMQKTYDLNSEEGAFRFANFRANIKKIKEMNDQNLGYTLGLGLFTDIDFRGEEHLKIFSSETQDELARKRNNIIDFDKMADLEDDESLEENNNDNNGFNSKNDWSYLFTSMYLYVAIGKNFVPNHAIQKSFAHVLNAHAKLQEVFKGEASPQFLRNCIRDGTEDIKTVYPAKSYTSFNQIPLDRFTPWSYYTSNCENPPAKPYYETRWTTCTLYGYPECTKNIIKNFLETGPYMSLITPDFVVLNYSKGIVPAEKCQYSASISAIVTSSLKEYLKALLPFGKSYGELGHIRVSHQTTGYELACGLESYAYLPTDIDYVE